jgi:hypothetical protein
MFRLSKTVLSFGAGALAVMALTLGAPKAAHALAATLVQVTNTAANPVVNQERDNQARNYYYSQASCNQITFGFCNVTFPTPPAGKREIITNISVLNLLPSSDAITSIDLRYLNGSIINFLPLVLNPGTATTTNYTTNETIFAKFDPGEQPQVLTFVQGSANFQMVATISGYMIDIP